MSYKPVSTWPTGASSYCYSNSAPTWETASSGSPNRNYVCMMSAIQIINPADLKLIPDQISKMKTFLLNIDKLIIVTKVFMRFLAVAVNTMITFTIPAYWGNDFTSIYKIAFGDSIKLTANYSANTDPITNVTTFTKLYATAATYTVSVNVTNAVSDTFFLKVNIEVMYFKQTFIPS